MGEKFEWQAQKLIKQMQAEGKVVALSREASAEIDHALAMAFEPIKNEFIRKEKASRAYIAKIESTTVEA